MGVEPIYKDALVTATKEVLTLQAEYTVRRGEGERPAAEDRLMTAPRRLSTIPGITILVIYKTFNKVKNVLHVHLHTRM